MSEQDAEQVAVHKVWIVIQRYNLEPGDAEWLISETVWGTTTSARQSAITELKARNLWDETGYRAVVFGDETCETRPLAVAYSGLHRAVVSPSDIDLRTPVEVIVWATEQGRNVLPFPSPESASTESPAVPAGGDGGEPLAEIEGQAPLFGAAEEDSGAPKLRIIHIVTDETEAAKLSEHVARAAHQSAQNDAEQTLLAWAQTMERAMVKAVEMAKALGPEREWYESQAALHIMAHASSGFSAAWISWNAYSRG